MFKVKRLDKVTVARVLLTQFPVVLKLKVPELVKVVRLGEVKVLFTVKIVFVFTSKVVFKIVKSLFKVTLEAFVMVRLSKVFRLR